MNNLIFSEAKTIAQFKSDNNLSNLPVVKNPNTGKIFLSWPGGSAAISSKWVKEESSVISRVTDEETGESFFMLHNEAKDNVLFNL
jgi:hypothetical protein